MANNKGSKRFRKSLVSIDQIMERSSKGGFLYFLANRAKVNEVWRKTVGPKVDANTLIHAFDLSVLEVYVRGPAHLERYRYFVKEWMERMNIEFGDELITEIVLKIGPLD
jgi:hypothetical protein